jgi:hypothetical protein
MNRKQLEDVIASQLQFYVTPFPKKSFAIIYATL